MARSEVIYVCGLQPLFVFSAFFPYLRSIKHYFPSISKIKGFMGYLLIIAAISLFWGLFTLLKNLYDLRARKIINRAKNIEQATQIRRRLLKLRTISLRTLIALSLVGYVWVVWEYPDVGLSFLVVFVVCSVIIYTQIVHEKSKSRLYGNLSYTMAEDFLKKEEDYTLYLRGFDDDVPFKKTNYAPASKLNEALLAEAIEYGLNVPMYALGMTKEIDSPVGAGRLYVNDDDWQEIVVQLMQRTKHIFILVSNRMSCLWEIEQARTMKDKVVFIVDDIDIYNEVRKLFGEAFSMPEPPQDSTQKFFFRCGEEPVAFEDSINGYLSIINLTLAEVEEQQLEQNRVTYRQHNSERIKNLWWKLLIALFVFFALLYICLYRGDYL